MKDMRIGVADHHRDPESCYRYTAAQQQREWREAVRCVAAVLFWAFHICTGQRSEGQIATLWYTRNRYL